MVPLLLLLTAGLSAGPAAGAAAAQSVEKQRVVSITSEQLSGGIVTELTWADGALVVQDAFLAPSGEIKAEYWVVPAELNRIAYVDGKGDLRVARADGGEPQRILRGDYTLPAWSDDGRAIAVAERKDGGRRWEISIAYLPEALRTPPRPASIAEPPAMP